MWYLRVLSFLFDKVFVIHELEVGPAQASATIIRITNHF